MNKKAIIEDVTEFIVATAIIVGITILAGLIVAANTQSKKQQAVKDIAMLNAQQETRVLLNYEIKPGYRLYDLVIDTVNANKGSLSEDAYKKNWQQLDSALGDAAKKFYPDGKEGWFFVVNSHVYYYNLEIVPYGATQTMPRMKLPNPYGDNVEVLFRKVIPTDMQFGQKPLELDVKR